MTTRTSPVRRRRLRDDRGSVSLWAIVITMAGLILVGLVVDGGGKIKSQQAADTAAREAARQAGQELQAAPAIRGRGAQADLAAGKRAAERYLSAAGVPGRVEVRSNTAITVTTTATYTPIFLSAIGVGAMTTQGQAEARIADGIIR